MWALAMTLAVDDGAKGGGCPFPPPIFRLKPPFTTTPTPAQTHRECREGLGGRRLQRRSSAALATPSALIIAQNSCITDRKDQVVPKHLVEAGSTKVGDEGYRPSRMER